MASEDSWRLMFLRTGHFCGPQHPGIGFNTMWEAPTFPRFLISFIFLFWPEVCRTPLPLRHIFLQEAEFSMELGRNGRASPKRNWGTASASSCATPGVERRNVPQVDTQVNSLLVPFSWDSFSSLQTEQELLWIGFSGNWEQTKMLYSKHSLKEQENSRFKSDAIFFSRRRQQFWQTHC